MKGRILEGLEFAVYSVWFMWTLFANLRVQGFGVGVANTLINAVFLLTIAVSLAASRRKEKSMK